MEFPPVRNLCSFVTRRNSTNLIEAVTVLPFPTSSARARSGALRRRGVPPSGSGEDPEPQLDVGGVARSGRRDDRR